MATVQTTVTTQTVQTKNHQHRRRWHGMRLMMMVASLALAYLAFIDIFMAWRVYTVISSSSGPLPGTDSDTTSDMTMLSASFVFGVNLAAQAMYLAYTTLRRHSKQSMIKQGIAIVAILAYPVADMVKYTLFHHILHTGVPYNTFLDGPVPWTSGLVLTIAGSLYLWYVLLWPQKSERQ